ncbi:MAG: hypothetical protein ACLRWQ_22815 [Flavonifractor plautii]
MDEQAVLDTLGLAGNLETARLMEHGRPARHCRRPGDPGPAVRRGKDVGCGAGRAVRPDPGSAHAKDGPQWGSALLTGGYDETTMRGLSELFTGAPAGPDARPAFRTTAAMLPRSSSRRTDAELCLIRLCDPGLDESTAALNARLARVEELLAGDSGGLRAVPGRLHEAVRTGEAGAVRPEGGASPGRGAPVGGGAAPTA